MKVLENTPTDGLREMLKDESIIGIERKAIENVLKAREDSEKLLERIEIDGTPFTLAIDKRGKKPEYNLLMGKYRISPNGEPFESKEEALEYIEKPSWETITQVIGVFIKEQELLK